MKIKNIILTSVIVLSILLILSIFILFTSCGKTAENQANSSEPSELLKTSQSAKSSESSEIIEAKAEVGYAAPDFSVELLNGKTVKLSDYKGKIVFLNFWASWCGPCVGEMPDIQKLSENYSSDLVVLAVNYGELKDTAESFIKKNNYTFNVGIDENTDIAKLYPSNGIPYSLIIDANGIITKIQEGIIPGEDMYSFYEGYIKAAMGK